MADLAEYKAALEYIQQLYAILNADYLARVSGGPRLYTSADLAKAVPGLAKAGTKLRKIISIEDSIQLLDIF